MSYDLSEMNFINLPRGRRLVPVPAASLRANLNVCYHPEMDLTAAELPLAGSGSDLSLILILPGKQAEFVAGGLGRLEDKINLGRGFMFNAVLITLRDLLYTHTHTHTVIAGTSATG